MSDETTLSSCPFCGGEATLKEYKPNVSGVAICKECGARSPICKNDHTGGWRPKAIAAWNARTHGTLTAEQVREVIEKCFDFDVWVPAARSQAIADELNAELGSGTCEQVLSDCDDGLMPPFTAHCSACGAEWGFTPRYCHNCGAKVTGTRDERKAVER